VFLRPFIPAFGFRQGGTCGFELAILGGDPLAQIDEFAPGILINVDERLQSVALCLERRERRLVRICAIAKVGFGLV